jgi:hypothetical protein
MKRTANRDAANWGCLQDFDARFVATSLRSLKKELTNNLSQRT